MSQSVEIVDAESIQIGRRIKEILEEKKREKGNAFSIRAFAKRIGMGKDMLGDITKGIRTVRPSELERIAKGLGLTVERLKGEDTKRQYEELSNLVKKGINLKRATQIANELFPLAIGCTERFEILNNVGAIHYLQREYRKATEIWEDAFRYAEMIHKLNGIIEPLYKVSFNLMNAYSQRKDYSNLSRMLEKVEPSFADFSPKSSATFCYSQAVVAFNMGDYDICEMKMYEHLKFFMMQDDALRIALAVFNVADMLYELGLYRKSLEYFIDAISRFEQHHEYRIIANKGYVKALLKLGKQELGVKIIESTLLELEGLEYPALKGKFLLLKASMINDIDSAKNVLSIEKADSKTKRLACQFLMDFYTQSGDANEVLKYHKIAMNHSQPVEWEVI